MKKRFENDVGPQLKKPHRIARVDQTIMLKFSHNRSSFFIMLGYN